jgi:hypothetical protein
MLAASISISISISDSDSDSENVDVRGGRQSKLALIVMSRQA